MWKRKVRLIISSQWKTKVVYACVVLPPLCVLGHSSTELSSFTVILHNTVRFNVQLLLVWKDKEKTINNVLKEENVSIVYNVVQL